MYLWIVDYDNYGNMDYFLTVAKNEADLKRQLKDEGIKPSQVELTTRLDKQDGYKIIVGDKV